MSTFSTSSHQKKPQNPQFFYTFDFEMCFAPQRACTFSTLFSTSEPPKVVRDRQFLTLLTWKCASRHNGVHFFSTSQLPKVVREWWFCTFWLGNVLRATTACTFSTSQLPKSGPTLRCFVRFWLGNVLRATNGVRFFDISTSKSGPTLRSFVHLTWKCASRHNGVHFRHLNFQKWSEPLVFCTFWLGNVLPRHNGVQFFIAPVASWLRTRRFSEPTFRPSWATNHWKKHSVSRLSYLFRASVSSVLLLFLFLSSSLLIFSSLCLCPALLFISPYCRNFDSKLPSIIIYLYTVCILLKFHLSPAPTG